MQTFYKVYSEFTLSHGKPQLVGLSLHSTLEYYFYMVSHYKKWLSNARFFYSLPEAEEYIKYLFKVHPTTTVSYPVLDANQLFLF